MSAPSLRELDKRVIGVELVLPGGRRFLRGVGRYERSSEVGPALFVEIHDPAGDFEIVLQEGKFAGPIEPCAQGDCEFLLQLDASCVFAR
jgi:hypothetical protein